MMPVRDQALVDLQDRPESFLVEPVLDPVTFQHTGDHEWPTDVARLGMTEAREAIRIAESADTATHDTATHDATHWARVDAEEIVRRARARAPGGPLAVMVADEILRIGRRRHQQRFRQRGSPSIRAQAHLLPREVV